MNKGMRDTIIALAVICIAFAAFFLWEASWQTPDDVRHYDEEPYYLTTPTEVVKGEMWTTPTYVPNTPTPAVTHTQAPTATLTPTPTNSPTPTPKPTESPRSASERVIGERYCEVNGTHGWKPLAWYTAVNDRSAPQWRLQQIAKTAENGVRVVQDPNGEWRYCVALPVYWAGGTHYDIGGCMDIYMANGAVLKCVLGDTKRVKKSVNGEGKYGIGHNEVIEVQCDLSKMNPIVPQMGDASYIGEEWVGDVYKIVVLDMFIEGVQE